jgi:hypothetical protein
LLWQRGGEKQKRELKIFLTKNEKPKIKHIGRKINDQNISTLKLKQGQVNYLFAEANLAKDPETKQRHHSP